MTMSREQRARRKAPTAIMSRRRKKSVRKKISSFALGSMLLVLGLLSALLFALSFPAEAQQLSVIVGQALSTLGAQVDINTVLMRSTFKIAGQNSLGTAF